MFKNPTAQYHDVHVISVIFPEQMQSSTVEISISDRNGESFELFTKKWSYDRKHLYLKGPFLFCNSYFISIAPGAEDVGGVALKEEFVTEVRTGENPLDMDRTSSCRSDVVISPVFTDATDAAVLPGDMVSRMVPDRTFRPADIDRRNVFYIDRSQQFDDASPMMIVPSIYRKDASGAAMMFVSNEPNEDHYSLELWAEYEPIDDLPASVILYDVQGAPPRELVGPFDMGDLDGDGFNDMVLSSERPIGDDVLQEIFMLAGPVAYGDGLYLTDVVGEGVMLGDRDEIVSRLYAVGDVNGDGMDDMVSTVHSGSSYGQPVEFVVRVHYGNEDVDAILPGDTDDIRVRSGRTVTDIEGGDINGDGYSDIIIAELERRSLGGSYRYVNPQISLLFGGKKIDGRSTLMPDSKLLFRSTEETFVAVRNVGDVDGDGINDIGIHVREEGANERTVSSKIYIFVGREIWHEQYAVYSPLIPKASVVIDVAALDDVLWKDAARIGDVNNDGYYDLMIVGEDGIERKAHFFLGEPSFGVWRGLKTTVTDADIKWTFR